MTYATIVLALFLQNMTGSLFSDSAPNVFLFRDLKARNVNDIVTIQIIENSSASNSANTSTKKEGDVSIKAPSVFGLEGGNSALNFASMLAGNSALSFAGQGSTSRTGQLQACVSARAVSVSAKSALATEGVTEGTSTREHQ